MNLNLFVCEEEKYRESRQMGSWGSFGRKIIGIAAEKVRFWRKGEIIQREFLRDFKTAMFFTY